MSVGSQACYSLIYVFSSFLVYCDRLVITLLYSIAKDTFKLLADSLNAHDIIGPSDDSLLGTEVDLIIENQRPEDAPQNPFFLAELILKPDKVEVDPPE